MKKIILVLMILASASLTSCCASGGCGGCGVEMTTTTMSGNGCSSCWY